MWDQITYPIPDFNGYPTHYKPLVWRRHWTKIKWNKRIYIKQLYCLSMKTCVRYDTIINNWDSKMHIPSFKPNDYFSVFIVWGNMQRHPVAISRNDWRRQRACRHVGVVLTINGLPWLHLDYGLPSREIATENPVTPLIEECCVTECHRLPVSSGCKQSMGHFPQEWVSLNFVPYPLY